jgi:DNA-binding NarL/FixJ family response regulator
MKEFPARQKIRVLLADDHPTVLLGLKAYLSAQGTIEVVGEAVSGREAVELCRTLLPDVAILDIGMPDMNGIEAASAIGKDFPDTKVIILSMHDEKEYIRQFLRCGASAYILKKSPPDELLRAIESVMTSGAYFSPQIADFLLKEHRTPVSVKPEPSLTRREEEVLRLVAKGKSSKQIADVMGISERTVSTYRQMLMEKLGIRGVAELTQYALSRKLI